MRRTPYLYLLAMGALACLVGCGNDTPRSDGYIPPVTDGPKTDKPPPPIQLTWAKSMLDGERAGRHLSLASNGGVLGIAYYRDLADDVTITCPASGIFPGGPKQRPAHDLYYIHHDGSAWGTPVKFDQSVGVTYGTSSVFDKTSGKIFVGYLGGAMSQMECSSSDAVIASSTDHKVFAKRTVAAAGLYAGDTVGYWTSVALDSKGADHAAHKDVLFGYYEQDGKQKANPMYDGEVIGGTTGPQYKKGGGDYMSLVFDEKDQPVVGFFNPMQQNTNGGILVAVKKGGIWTINQVVPGATSERISMKTDGKGLFGIAYYEPSKQLLRYAEAATSLTGWVDDVVDPDLTHNGEFASLAYDSKGQPAISYYKCGKYQDTTCDLTRDGLKFAWRLNGSWQTWDVDSGDANRCGTYTSLAFGPNDEPVIAYQCVALTASKEFLDTLKVARGVVK
jgi:hypothetical protein